MPLMVFFSCVVYMYIDTYCVLKSLKVIYMISISFLFSISFFMHPVICTSFPIDKEFALVASRKDTISYYFCRSSFVYVGFS